jgi:hypothetical protein
MRIAIVVMWAALAGSLIESAAAQEAKSISPGMSEAQVQAILGAPLQVRSFGDHTYYFYENDCEDCGRDLVIFQDDAVVDCVFSHPGRTYTGVSGTIVVDAAASAAEEGGAMGAPVLAADRAVSAGSAEHVPDAAKQLVVHVIGYFDESSAEQLGAGIIFGATDERIYIVTADHVLRYRGQEAEEVRVAFLDRPRELVAAERDRAHTQLDLAVISVPREWVGAFEEGGPEFDRLGDVGALKTGDRVTPMGCPNGECWVPPATPDRVFAKGRFSLSFESVSITTGYSGGGLFNEWWEIVGMITAREGQIARADAIPVNTLVETVAGWDYPVDLSQPAVPRGGYRRSIDVLALSAGSGTSDGRFPSGRGTYSQMITPTLGWHAGALRLTPENLTLSAVVAGLDASLRAGRFTARPFLEAGFGRMEARFDTGGYYVDDGDGLRYVPNWSMVEDDGLGGGLGLNLDFLVVPHVMLELLGGYWVFNTPEDAPSLPDVVFGAGLRFGF